MPEIPADLVLDSGRSNASDVAASIVAAMGLPRRA